MSGFEESEESMSQESNLHGRTDAAPMVRARQAGGLVLFGAGLLTGWLVTRRVYRMRIAAGRYGRRLARKLSADRGR